MGSIMQIQQTITQAWLHLFHVVPNTVFIFSIGYLMRQRQFFKRDVIDIHQQKKLHSDIVVTYPCEKEAVLNAVMHH
jgi:hypothetical protein